MNPQIRELAQQAGAYFGEKLEHSVIFDELDDFENFVQLIVRECADEIYNHYADKSTDSGIVATTQGCVLL